MEIPPKPFTKKCNPYQHPNDPNIALHANYASKIILMIFFAEKEKLNLSLIWNCKGPHIDNFEKRKESWKTHTSQLQNLLQSHSNQTMWYWHNDRHIDLWNKTWCPK